MPNRTDQLEANRQFLFAPTLMRALHPLLLTAFLLLIFAALLKVHPPLSPLLLACGIRLGAIWAIYYNLLILFENWLRRSRMDDPQFLALVPGVGGIHRTLTRHYWLAAMGGLVYSAVAGYAAWDILLRARG